MKRRALMAAIGGTVAWPMTVHSQQTAKVARIGLLIGAPLDSPVVRSVFDVIRRQFNLLGYVEGRSIIFEERGATGTVDQLRPLATELVNLRVDAIIAIATLAARAAQEATSTIPIVFGSAGDPVQDGLVASLSRPGGNLTGTTFLGPELGPKRLSLLKELIPSMTRVAVLWHPGAFSDVTTAAMTREIKQAADSLGLQVSMVEARGPEEFKSAFGAIADGHADALFEFPSPTFYENRRSLVELAARHRLPAMFIQKEFVELGGLIAYGASILDLNGRTAIYVDRILKGARPSDLPVEQPTQFELAINRTTAKTLGIEIPQTMLAASDELID